MLERISEGIETRKILSRKIHSFCLFAKNKSLYVTTSCPSFQPQRLVEIGLGESYNVRKFAHIVDH